MNPQKIKRIIEALILSHEGPMSLARIKEALAMDLSSETLRLLIEDVRVDWSQRAVNLVQVSSGYRFQTAAEMQPYLDRLRVEKPVQYSRAVLETLAIIAYRQPVTRGDIEDIRGVTVSSNIIKTLEERGWIESVGHREVPGRPSLLATTQDFLNDLGLRSLKELPALKVQSDGDKGQLELVAMLDTRFESPVASPSPDPAEPYLQT
jgi:segregation and condensation protein B